MPEATSTRPAIDGWFAVGDDGAHLIGARCGECGTYVFPPRATGCPNPACTNDELEAVPLARTGTLWSYTENRYQPPPPYPQADPFEPYALAAVELAEEGLVVLGRAAIGVLAADLRVGMTMEVAIEPLYVDDDGDERTVYVWKPVVS
jgi:uncharacterized OB-fold protein